MFESRRGYHHSTGGAGAGSAGADRRHPLLAVALVAGLLLPLRALVAASAGLGDAEAYYWTWSREPSLSYFDHGPLVALLIRLGTSVLGTSTIGVRLPFVVLSSLTLLLVASAACRLAAARGAPRSSAALAASLAILCMPASIVAGAAANPDVPYLAAVAAFVWILSRPESRGSPGWAALAGAMVGVAFAAKYFALLLLPAGLALASSSAAGKRLRQEPGGSGLAGACRRRLLAAAAFLGTALVGALPVLVWNLRNGFATLRYHLWLRHARRRTSGNTALALGALAGGQLAYVSPFVLFGLVAALVALWRERQDETNKLLLWAALPPLAGGCLLIFLVPGSEPHWTLAGYLPAAAALGARLPAWTSSRAWARHLRLAALAFSTLLALLLHVHVLTDLGVRLMPDPGYVPRLDLSNELRGWPEVADQVAVEISRAGEAAVTLAAGAHYTSCSQLVFSSRGRFEVICPSPRLDQFDFFAGGDGASRRGVDLLYVRDERFPYDANELYRCQNVQRSAPVVVRRAGRPVRRFELQRCLGFAGLRASTWPPDREPAGDTGPAAAARR